MKESILTVFVLTGIYIVTLLRTIGTIDRLPFPHFDACASLFICAFNNDLNEISRRTLKIPHFLLVWPYVLWLGSKQKEEMVLLALMIVHAILENRIINFRMRSSMVVLASAGYYYFAVNLNPMWIVAAVCCAVASFLKDEVSRFLTPFEGSLLLAVLTLLIYHSTTNLFHVGEKNENHFDASSLPQQKQHQLTWFVSSTGVLVSAATMVFCSQCLLVCQHYHSLRTSFMGGTVLQNRVAFFVLCFAIVTAVSFNTVLQAMGGRTAASKWFVEIFNSSSSLLEFKVGIYWLLLIFSFSWFANFARQTLNWRTLVVRKIFHFLIVLMFTPVIAYFPLRNFLCLATAVAGTLFVLLEYVRTCLLDRYSSSTYSMLNTYLGQFLVDKERPKPGQDRIIMAHISLLLGCGGTIWLSELIGARDGSSWGQRLRQSIMGGSSSSSSVELPQQQLISLIVAYLGIGTIGVGDSFAAVCGSTYGRCTWSSSNSKTILGSICAYLSMCFYAICLLCAYVYCQVGNTTAASMLQLLALVLQQNFIALFVVTLPLTALMEAFTVQTDNFVLPLFSSMTFLTATALLSPLS